MSKPEASINVAHLHVGDPMTSRLSAIDEQIIVELVSRLTKESFEQHLDKLAARIKAVGTPVIQVIGVITTMLVALIVWVFLTLAASVKELNNSVNRLEITVSAADRSVAAMQDQLQETKDGLSKLEERMYRRDGRVR